MTFRLANIIHTILLIKLSLNHAERGERETWVFFVKKKIPACSILISFFFISAFPVFSEFTQTIPDSNSSELVENVKLSGRCYCIFPPPSVKLYLRVGVSINTYRISLLSS